MNNLLDQIIIKYGRKPYLILFKYAKRYIEKTKYKNAIVLLIMANKLRPTNLNCIKYICDCYIALGQDKNAFLWAEKIIIQQQKNDLGFKICSKLLLKDRSLEFRDQVLELLENYTIQDMISRASSLTYPCWWTLCYQYYCKKLKKGVYTFNRAKHFKNNNKPRVFIFVNNTKESKTSSHLAFLSNFMATFENNNIECHLLISPHPYPALGKFARVGLRDTNLSDLELANKVKGYIEKLAGPPAREYRVKCLFDLSNKKMTVKKYFFETTDNVLALDICEEDIIILPGGVCGSTLLAAISAYLPARIYFMMFSGTNKFNEIKNIADYIIHPSANYEPTSGNAYNSGFNKNQILHNVIAPKPFYWEENNAVNFTQQESEFLKQIELIEEGNFILTAALQLELRINKEFHKIIIRLLSEKSNLYVVMIGTKAKKLFKLFPRLRKYRKRIIFLEFADHLFSIYKKLSSKNIVYIFPRVCGSGRTNVYAAYAGIPIVLFRGNDAESQLPATYFVNKTEEMVDKIFMISENQEYKSKYVEDVINDRNNRTKNAERFYLDLLQEKKYPKIYE